MSRSPTTSNSLTDLFDQFIGASTLKGVLSTFRRICHLLELSPGPFNQFYPSLKKGITGPRANKNWKAQSIFSKIERKANSRVYHGSSSVSRSSAGSHLHHHHHLGINSNNVLMQNNCLVIGGGPCGLRTAIELQLLGGHQVVVVEKRDRFSRNNVLHLWPFVISDLKLLAGKKFYGKFCAGSIDHVSIRQLQLMLLKIALIIGCEFIENVTFENICPQNLPGLKGREEGRGNGCDSTPVCSNGSPANTPSKRKLNFTPDLLSNKEEPEAEEEGEELDGNVCSVVAEEAEEDPETIEEDSPESSASGTLDSEEDSDSSDDDENGEGDRSARNEEDEEAIKEKHDVSSQGKNGTRSQQQEEKEKCRCCCHLHAHGKGTRQSSDHYMGAFAHFSLTCTNPATASGSVDFSRLLDRLHGYEFDILVGADGRRNTLSENFPRKEFRGRLAIAITANFINSHTLAEAQVPEVSGISFIYNQQLFKSLYDDTGIDLENICYYKDDTHYFVMTAKKSSLLARGVLINDFPETRSLLSPDNINRTNLLTYAKDASKWTTGLESQSFALNHYGEPDVAMFDFTSMYAADNACRAKRIVASTDCVCRNCSCDSQPYKKKLKSDEPESPTNWRGSAADENTQGLREGLLLIGLVGDSLLEPFWPTGSGCARGFLSAMDAAWMARQWAVKQCNVKGKEEAVLSVLCERESIYRLLGQTKPDNLSPNYASHTLNPITRYPNLNTSLILPHMCKHLLYDDYPSPAPYETRVKQSLAAKRLRRATIATATPANFKEAAENNLLATARRLEERRLEVVKRQEEEEAAAASQTFEESLVAFEDSLSNYQLGLIVGTNSSSSNCSSSAASSSTLLSSSVPNRGFVGPPSQSNQYYDLSMSPSASNLATLGKSRAKDIESALRDRRNKQQTFQRSNYNQRGQERLHQQDGQSCDHVNHMQQQLKSKAAWFLDQSQGEGSSSTASSGVFGSSSSSGSFANRIKDLEAKLYASSGLSYLDAATQETLQQLNQAKLLAAKGTHHVLETATNLEQLLNPKYQEEKLKKDAADHRRKRQDLRTQYVSKITKEDWAVRCLEAKASASPPPPTSQSPTPGHTELVGLIKDRLNEKSTVPHHKDVLVGENTYSGRDAKQKKRTPREKDALHDEKDGDWISLLKGELNQSPKEKVKPKKETPKVYFSPFGENQPEKSSKASQPTTPLNTVLKNCMRCKQIVATVDRILLSGVLLHRGCLTCSRCGITLRLSEVRGNNISAERSDSVGEEETTGPEKRTFLCLLCSNNKVNNNSNTRRGFSSNQENRINDRMAISLEGTLLEPPIAPVVAPVPIFAATDEYENRLKQRMKWKEQFLLNNNNLDFTSLINKSEIKAVNSDHAVDPIVVPEGGATSTPTVSPKSASNINVTPETKQINERIEYENTSMSFELFDEDEVTKLLNLETDQWESGDIADNSTSDSDSDWDQESDSTDNDFDSDEFDCISASEDGSSRRERLSSGHNKESSGGGVNRAIRAENELLASIVSFEREQASNSNRVVPEIVVVPEVEDDEIGNTTGDEVDTQVLDGSSQRGVTLSSEANENTTISATTSVSTSFASSIATSKPSDLQNGAESSSKTENENTSAVTSSSSDSDDSDTLAERSTTGKKTNDARTPTKEMEAKIPLLSFLDSESKAMDEEDEDEETNTTVSSLSCDFSGTFDDINLVSLMEDNTASTSIYSTTNSRRAGLTGFTQESPLKSTTRSYKTLTTPLSSLSMAPSMSTAASKTSPLTASTLVNTSIATSTTSNPSSPRQSSNPLFKVATPKFTVFNFNLEDKYILPTSACSPLAKSDSNSSTTSNSSQRKDDFPEKETYSKIPVLASRVAGANASATLSPAAPGLIPSYSGSFTEKMLQRCRSTPALIGAREPFSKWSTQRSFDLNRTLSPTLTTAVATPASTAHKLNHCPVIKSTIKPPSKRTTGTSQQGNRYERGPESAQHTKSPSNDVSFSETVLLFADSDTSPTEHKEPPKTKPSQALPTVMLPHLRIPPKVSKQGRGSLPPLSTRRVVKTPSPSFYDRFSKELLRDRDSSRTSLVSSSPKDIRVEQAPRATFDELLDEDEDLLKAEQGSRSSDSERLTNVAVSGSFEESTGRETLRDIENRLKTDAVDEERLLRQWFKLKNREQ